MKAFRLTSAVGPQPACVSLSAGAGGVDFGHTILSSGMPTSQGQMTPRIGTSQYEIFMDNHGCRLRDSNTAAEEHGAEHKLEATPGDQQLDGLKVFSWHVCMLEGDRSG